MNATKTARQQAADKIQGTIHGDYVEYYDDNMRVMYRNPVEDLDYLAELMDSDDEAIRADAYSHWCAGTESEELAKYSVQTDGFLCDDFWAANLDEAIEYAFTGEGLGKIVDEASLHAKFAKYVADGGWCVIERDGEEILKIGSN
jgi:hypothetical protein